MIDEVLMRWWGRALPLCAAVLLVAGCDLRPVTDQVSVIDTFAVPSSIQGSTQASDDTIPHVVAEPIGTELPVTGAEPSETDVPATAAEPGEAEVPVTGANPNEHRSHADAPVPADPPTAEPTPADAATDEPDDSGQPGADRAPGATRSEPGGRDAPSEPADEADGPAPAAGGDSEPAPAEPASPPTAPPARPVAPSPSATATVPLSAIERQIVELLNAEREAAGLQPLTVDAGLTHGARAWATTMARGGAFDHESEGGFSENIAYGYADATEVHEAWMASPGHRANRMRPGLQSYGIGVRAAGTTLYFAERFR